MPAIEVSSPAANLYLIKASLLKKTVSPHKHQHRTQTDSTQICRFSSGVPLIKENSSLATSPPKAIKIHRVQAVTRTLRATNVSRTTPCLFLAQNIRNISRRTASGNSYQTDDSRCRNNWFCFISNGNADDSVIQPATPSCGGGTKLRLGHRGHDLR